MFGDKVLEAWRQASHQHIQILPLIDLIVHLAEVCKDLSLHILGQVYVLHGSRCELYLFIELSGATVKRVKHHIHCADDVRMNKLTHNDKYGDDYGLMGVRRDHVRPVEDAH